MTMAGLHDTRPSSTHHGANSSPAFEGLIRAKQSARDTPDQLVGRPEDCHAGAGARQRSGRPAGAESTDTEAAWEGTTPGRRLFVRWRGFDPRPKNRRKGQASVS